MTLPFAPPSALAAVAEQLQSAAAGIGVHLLHLGRLADALRELEPQFIPVRSGWAARIVREPGLALRISLGAAATIDLPLDGERARQLGAMLVVSAEEEPG